MLLDADEPTPKEQDSPHSNLSGIRYRVGVATLESSTGDVVVLTQGASRMR